MCYLDRRTCPCRSAWTRQSLCLLNRSLISYCMHGRTVGSTPTLLAFLRQEPRKALQRPEAGVIYIYNQTLWLIYHLHRSLLPHSKNPTKLLRRSSPTRRLASPVRWGTQALQGLSTDTIFRSAASPLLISNLSHVKWRYRYGHYRKTEMGLPQNQTLAHYNQINRCFCIRPARHYLFFFATLYNSSWRRHRVQNFERSRHGIRQALKHHWRLCALKFVRDLVLPVYVFHIQWMFRQFTADILQLYVRHT